MSASSVARGARARVAPASRAEGAVGRARVPPATLPQHSHPRTRASLDCPLLPTRVAVADRAALASRSRGRSAARAARQGGALYLWRSVADIERTKILNNEARVRARARLLSLPSLPRARPPLASPRRPFPDACVASLVGLSPTRASALPITHHSPLGRFLAFRAALGGRFGRGRVRGAAPRRRHDASSTASNSASCVQMPLCPHTPHLCIARAVTAFVPSSTPRNRTVLTRRFPLPPTLLRTPPTPLPHQGGGVYSEEDSVITVRDSLLADNLAGEESEIDSDSAFGEKPMC